MIKISIISVTYNNALTIKDTLESVLYQTYPNIEFIIVDGFSTDNTANILKEYEPKFNGRMHWISEKDTGMYDAMNKGIKMSTGEIIGIINGDDFYHRKDVIDEIAKAFENNEIQATIADIRFVNPNNLSKTIRYCSSKNFTVDRFRLGFMPAHPSFFTYKENYNKFGYYQTDYKIAADFELLLRFLFTYKLKYKYLSLDIMKMRTGGISTASWKSNFIINKEIVRGCRENGIYTNLFILSLKYFVKVFELIQTKN